MSAKKILIIEDEPAVSELIRRKLEMAGYETSCAFNGSQAGFYARTGKPDLITLDLNIPAESGEIVYSKLKAADATKNIPVLIVSSEADSMRVEKMIMKTGAVKEDIFSKPIDFAALLGRIAFYLSEKTAQD